MIIISNNRWSFKQVKDLFDSKGIELLTDNYINCRQKIYFRCSNCKGIHYTTIKNYTEGSNVDFLCKSCSRNRRTSSTVNEIKDILLSKGAMLDNSTYINKHSMVNFNCSKCGGSGKITLGNYQRGINKDLLCEDCLKDLLKAKKSNSHVKYSIADIAKEFEAKGSTLLSKEFISSNVALKFKCTRCGKEHHIRYADFKRGRNPNLLCTECLIGHSYNPLGNYGKNRRHLVDSEWFKLILKFFNVDRDLYSAHHISLYSKDISQRTSLTNGYPVLKEFHKNSAIFNGVKNPFHTYFHSILNYPKEVKLPYHTYDNFSFLDLSSKLRTDIIVANDKKLISYKEELYNKGIDYIPIFFSELFVEQKRDIIFSMIKNRLWKNFKQIYQYTGTELEKYYARDLCFKEVPFEEAKNFLNRNHIQGFISAEYYFGLYDINKELISIMTFGKPRFCKKFNFELLRLATKINTIVVGGSEKLFKNSLKILGKGTIISYCDIRFSSFDPYSTVYSRLGFIFSYISKPSYKYVDQLTNRVYSRMQCQKHMLKRKLDNFDENLSERENMSRNNFVRIYDCGNFVFFYNNI